MSRLPAAALAISLLAPRPGPCAVDVAAPENPAPAVQPIAASAPLDPKLAEHMLHDLGNPAVAAKIWASRLAASADSAPPVSDIISKTAGIVSKIRTARQGGYGADPELRRSLLENLSLVSAHVQEAAPFFDSSSEQAAILGSLDALVSEQRRTVTLYEHLFQAEDGRPFQVELRPVNAADLLSQAAGFKTREALEKKNISLVLQAPPDLSVLGNPDVLGIVLDNLLGNAGKYTPQGGRILLAASRFPRGRLATISVSDSGIGLSAEDQALVLSAEGGRTEAAKKMASGDGLGLPAVAAFLGANGSALRLLSVPRAGSTFFFRLTTIR